MKNKSLWATAAILLLVGVAIFYEVQYRQVAKSEHVAPTRPASAPQQREAPKPPPSATRARMKITVANTAKGRKGRPGRMAMMVRMKEQT